MIMFILVNGRQPAQRLISPVVSSLHTFYSVASAHIPSESFAFVPDLAQNKFPSIDLDGLTHLSFFDIPLDEDGTLNRSSRGYLSFTSDQASELFDKARYQKTKIFLTLSALQPSVIEGVLNNPEAQEKLAADVLYEIENSDIDGITVDFEYPKGEGKEYQEKFTKFISFLTSTIHSKSPDIQVAVALPSSQVDKSLYNVKELSEVSDRIFLIASDFIVPEVKGNTHQNPVFGFDETEYFSKISKLLNSLAERIPSSKLVLERAWYGNGDQYPLYIPNNTPPNEKVTKAANPIQLDQDTVDRLTWGVPQKGKAGARKNIPLIAQALHEEGILDSNVLAYALATVEHETDETFEPIEEIGGKINARRFGYEGGSNYFGRGFIQITHLRNYRSIGQRIGMGDQLVKNPDLASTPYIAAKILAAFFKDNNVANLASQGRFIAARTPVNPDYNGRAIANLALKYDLY